MAEKQIACCVDFSQNADAAFVTALEMAEKYLAKLLVIHVLPLVVNPILTAEWVLPEEPKNNIIIELEKRMQKEYGDRVGDKVDYQLIVLDGHVSTAILTFLNENPVDIVVVGSYGLTGMGLVFFGSVAKRISYKAPCSVMIVRDREKIKDKTE
ncbi:MAG: universal stress protein [Desulfobacterales bacterium]